VETEPARVFDELVAPVMPLLVEEAQKWSHDAGKYTLSFQPFTLNLLFALIKSIKSMSLLVTHTKTSTEAQTLELVTIDKMNEVEPVKNEQNDEMESEPRKETSSPSMFSICGLVFLLGDRVRAYWKMDIHWLTTVRNLLLLPFTPEVSRLIWSRQ
jgi:hypothetical protein